MMEEKKQPKDGIHAVVQPKEVLIGALGSGALYICKFLPLYQRRRFERPLGTMNSYVDKKLKGLSWDIHMCLFASSVRG